MKLRLDAVENATDMLSFCILIVNYHGREDTIACVKSVLAAAATLTSRVKIVIVDNSAETFDFEGEPVRVMRTGHNVGLSGAWYVGFYSEIAQSCDYTIFLNNDAYVAEDFFIYLQKGIEKWGANCAFGPRIYDASDSGLIWSRGGEIKRFAVKVKHFGENVRASAVEPGDFETGHLSGCCMIVRNAHLNQIGGPDTNFFFRGEEWDLNYRLIQAGVRLILLDQTNVFHAINGSHFRFAPNMLYLAYRAKVLFAKKILPWWYFPIWYPVALLYAATVAPLRFARSSNSSAQNIRRALISAFLEGLRNDKIMPPTKADW
jgi:GT2 family glycosyltransferase